MNGTMNRALSAGVLALAACTGAPKNAGAHAPRTSDSLAIARSRAAANALGQDLQGLLFAQLERGGPATAIAFCADSAQVRTARHAAEGVYVRRVSLKARNPANAPDDAERAGLEALAARYAAGEQPAEVIEVGGTGTERTLQYLRPIVVQEKCLACHGDPAAFDPAVAQVLATRYPADRATGYRVGDFRGVISVRVPAPE